MQAKVLVTREIPKPAIDILKKMCEVKVNELRRSLTKEELVGEVKDIDGLLPLSTDVVDSEIMDAAPELKVISNHAVGYDNIDVEVATKKGIMVTNTPGVLTDTTADLTFSLIMAVARRVVEADRFTREGKYKEWSPTLMLGKDVHHSILGIIGFGRIGRAVARRAAGFNMKILYYDEKRASEDIERKIGAEFVPFEHLLERADFVSLHTPLLSETRHIISEKELRMMKKTAYLINAARGPLVDEKALVKALCAEWIAGAGLDVYENEPELTPGLVELDNCVLLPHIGSASIETRNKMAITAAKNLVAGLKGEVPPNLVNREILEKVKR